MKVPPFLVHSEAEITATTAAEDRIGTDADHPSGRTAR